MVLEKGCEIVLPTHVSKGNNSPENRYSVVKKSLWYEFTSSEGFVIFANTNS